MKNTLFLLLCLFFLPFARAQQPVLTADAYRALNNYIVYGNEAVLQSALMFDEFVFINQKFNLFLEQQATLPDYEPENLLLREDYFLIPPERAYGNIFADNQYLPADKRGALLQLAGKTHNLIEELNGLRNSLKSYINGGQYKEDKLLSLGYKNLRRAEVLYYDLFTLQEKIYWAVNELFFKYQKQPFNEANINLLRKFQPLVTQTQELLKSVRAQDFGKSLRRQATSTYTLLGELKQQKSSVLASIPPVDSSAFCFHKRYDWLISKGQNLTATSVDYLQNPSKYQNQPHLPHYYYYNEELLPQYNRPNDGIVAAFNKLIMSTGEQWVLSCELPLIFEVVYPKLADFEQYRKDLPMPDPEELAKQWKRRQDSLYQDSLRMAANPQIGDKTLKGFAANNLIFLLDVSYSMDEAEKLPLLKKSLQELLPIMRQEDLITIITYSGEATVQLPPTSALEQEKILQVIAQLRSKGTSDADQGLQIAYENALQSYIANGNNRIIMATDGKFELSPKTRKLVKKAKKKGLFLSVFYFSNKEFPTIKTQLSEISQLGGGAYRYVQPDNAEKTLLMEAQAIRSR